MSYNAGSAATDIVSTTGTGALLGSSVAPGVGTLIGAGVGALAGVFKAWSNTESENQKQQILEDAAKQYNTSVAQLKSEIVNYYNTAGIGTADDVSKLKKLVSSYNPNDYVYNPEDNKFSYDKSVDDFVNPYKDKILDEVGAKVSASAAGAGLGRGTGAARAIAAAEAEKDEQLYDTALSQYNADRAQSYNEWNSYTQSMQNYLNTLNNNMQYQIAQYNNLASDYENTQAQKQQQLAALSKDAASANLQLQLAKV